MEKERRAGKPVVRIKDKRRGGEEAPAVSEAPAPEGLGAPTRSTRPEEPGGPGAVRNEDSPQGVERPETGSSQRAGPSEETEASDYLNDLRRLQAEFDNYRKRMIKEQTAVARRTAARLIERLLPVLDNFDAAVSHGQGGTGIELVYKELKTVLESEGLEEITADGAPFDPAVHEAVETRESPDVTEMTVAQVYRRGYRLDGRVLRPAMVAVVRPAEPGDDPGEVEPTVEEAE
jgi:molecular chaperone GrpE